MPVIETVYPETVGAAVTEAAEAETVYEVLYTYHGYEPSELRASKADLENFSYLDPAVVAGNLSLTAPVAAV